MSWTFCQHDDDQNVIKFQQHWNLLQHQFSENPRMHGIPDDDLEKEKWNFSFSVPLLNSLGQEEYIT